MWGRGGAFWSPPPEPARSPGLSAGGVIHQSSAGRLLEGRRRHQGNIPPRLSPKETGDDGAGEGGEERKDEAAGRRSEAKASTPSYSDLTPCHPPSPSSLAFSSPPLLPGSAKTPVRRLQRRNNKQPERPGGSRRAAPLLGGQEGAPLVDNSPKTSGRGNAGITNDLQPRLPAEPRRDQEIHHAKDQAHSASASTSTRRQ